LVRGRSSDYVGGRNTGFSKEKSIVHLGEGLKKDSGRVGESGVLSKLKE